MKSVQIRVSPKIMEILRGNKPQINSWNIFFNTDPVLDNESLVALLSDNGFGNRWIVFFDKASIRPADLQFAYDDEAHLPIFDRGASFIVFSEEENVLELLNEKFLPTFFKDLE